MRRCAQSSFGPSLVPWQSVHSFNHARPTTAALPRPGGSQTGRQRPCTHERGRVGALRLRMRKCCGACGAMGAPCTSSLAPPVLCKCHLGTGSYQNIHVSGASDCTVKGMQSNICRLFGTHAPRLTHCHLCVAVRLAPLLPNLRQSSGPLPRCTSPTSLRAPILACGAAFIWRATCRADTSAGFMPPSAPPAMG